MIGVLIVDDEPYVREMIRTMVDWESLSMQVEAEAYNGEVALEMLARAGNRISLVITDIRMPVLDGLALIQRAVTLDPQLQFIVISAYDDFHLVKEAFKLGAKDYLLKSEITGAQICSVLSNMKSRLASGNPPADFDPPARQRENFLLKENLLTRLINGSTNIEDLKTLRSLEKTAQGERVALMMTRLVHTGSGSDDPAPAESFRAAWSAWLHQQDDTIGDLQAPRFEIVQVTPYEFGLLAIYARSVPASVITRHLHALHSSTRPAGYCVNSGLSHIATDFDLLPKLVHEARLALGYCFINGNGSIIRYDINWERHDLLEIDTDRQIAALKQQLAAISLRRNSEEIHDVLLHPEQIHTSNINAIKDLYLQYHFILVDYARQNNLGVETTALLSEFEINLKYSADLAGLNNWLTTVLRSMAGKPGSSSVINQVKFYLEMHYAEDVSLHSVARSFDLNSSYLSRIFSEKEHQSFIDYLSRIRMKKAVELLQNSNLRIYEVCERIGYPSPEHFSRTFKKMIGKSPKQFMLGRESSNRA